MPIRSILLMVSAFGSSGPVDYQCLDGASFTLLTTEESAVVKFADREYRLVRRPSSLAIKYESSEATLYLENEIAAFVATDRPLPGCHTFKIRKAEN